AGCVTLAFGIFFQVSADLIMNPGEGFVQIIAKKTKFRFGVVKILFDASLVSGAIAISIILLGSIEGVREGTVISAGLVGYIIILISAGLKKIRFQEWLAR
ncbi:MAG: YitT family protein, partial [Methanospirillum sp.]|nr:YitT family protein [Methanospirillum sp.]